jgi:hypothetical protein
VAWYFAVKTAGSHFGTPDPAPTVRVRFDPGKLLAARERWPGHQSAGQVAADDGLLVHSSASEVLIWPDQLWRVADLEDPVRVVPSAEWVRCQAFTVVAAEPAWLVAGPHGTAVEQVIAAARSLTPDQVAALAGQPVPEEEALLTRTLWQRWSAGHRSGSPVGCGLATLYQAVEHAARHADPGLFAWDEDDGIEVLADPVWQRAHATANCAALAFGAPDILTPWQNAQLARPWVSVFGRPREST